MTTKEELEAVLDAKEKETPEEVKDDGEVLQEDKQAVQVDEQEPDEDEEESAAESEDTVVEEEGVEDWLSKEDVVELLDSLGMTKEDLVKLNFQSQEELERAVMLADKQATPAEKTSETPRDEKGRFLPREQPKQEEPPQGEPDYEPELDTDYVDEVIPQEFKRLHGHLSSQNARLQAELASLREEIATAREDVIVSQFDNLLDSLGYEELFGKSAGVKPGTSLEKNRETAYEAARTLMAAGKKLSPGLVRRAVNMEFHDELTRKERAALTTKAKKQAARKLGGKKGTVREERPFEGDPLHDPVVHEAYKAMMEGR